jgi:hypothetical protein
MAKPSIRIHNVELDEVIDREMTDDEFAKYQEAQAYFAFEKAELKSKAEAKSALLERLGITAEEAALLLS